MKSKRKLNEKYRSTSIRTSVEHITTHSYHFRFHLSNAWKYIRMQWIRPRVTIKNFAQNFRQFIVAAVNGATHVAIFPIEFAQFRIGLNFLHKIRIGETFVGQKFIKFVSIIVRMNRMFDVTADFRQLSRNFIPNPGQFSKAMKEKFLHSLFQSWKIEINFLSYSRMGRNRIIAVS